MLSHTVKAGLLGHIWLPFTLQMSKSLFKIIFHRIFGWEEVTLARKIPGFGRMEHCGIILTGLLINQTTDNASTGQDCLVGNFFVSIRAFTWTDLKWDDGFCTSKFLFLCKHLRHL